MNDVTLRDAEEVRLNEVCEVLDNGNELNKIDFAKMNPERLKLLKEADLIISKGQANCEGLRGCGLNIYYVFLCKCVYFAKTFNAKQFDSIFAREKK